MSLLKSLLFMFGILALVGCAAESDGSAGDTTNSAAQATSNQDDTDPKDTTKPVDTQGSADTSAAGELSDANLNCVVPPLVLGQSTDLLNKTGEAGLSLTAGDPLAKCDSADGYFRYVSSSDDEMDCIGNIDELGENCTVGWSKTELDVGPCKAEAEALTEDVDVYASPDDGVILNLEEGDTVLDCGPADEDGWYKIAHVQSGFDHTCSGAGYSGLKNCTVGATKGKPSTQNFA